MKEHERLWKAGLIGMWYLYDYQQEVYEFLLNTRNPFFEATRRFGKTTTMLIKATEDCQKQDERVVIWCEPWKEQARNIVVPEMKKICTFADDATRPRFYRTDSFFEFPDTGARIYMVGLSEDRGEGIRGRTANEIIVDEMGSLVDAGYVINEVLRPLLLTTGGELIEMGTPPGDLGHLWYERKARAIQENRFIQRTIDTVDAIPDDEKARYIEEMGGRMSDAVRRELYCEPVADTKSLVIPEFKEELHVYETYERPKYFDPYVSFDLGFNDFTAVLFGYLDWLNQRLIIERELIVNGKNSKEIVSSARSIEQSLWGMQAPYLRVSDNDLQQLYDMQTMFDYNIVPTRKDDKHSAVNDLRLKFQQKRVLIHKSCKSTIFQLKVGMWNERKKDFVRGESTGHLDAIDALVYMNRNVSWTKNPFPGVDSRSIAHDHFVPPPEKPFKNGEEDSILSAFEPFELDGF